MDVIIGIIKTSEEYCKIVPISLATILPSSLLNLII
jgi:hypothetical protein